MKKLILLSSVFVFMFGFGQAQESSIDKRSSLTFGAKIGLNYSNVYDSEGEEFDADAKFGLASGLFVCIPVSEYLGIQPEILFSQKGFKATGSVLGSEYSFTRTTNYLDIPLMVAFRPSEFFSIVAGPQYSYLLSRKDVFHTSTMTIEQEEEFENDNIRKNTFCVTGGVDITISHIVLGARVGWDLFNNNGDGTSTTPRYKNVWYQATIGYRF
ncbi:MAG TPA: PorT family protein [Bacteroidales bacterium]|nr:MAG: hypothetical protein A2W94_04755 [Bacteroidetes bacterium GWE2_42_42]HBG71589.1 PorT family protein [Bacteroidales bacterium]HCB62122.1 PorT family protein [Bacteroidales bacterium]HCY22350.1 PorT family protein [Bacteroidales bacterium]